VGGAPCGHPSLDRATGVLQGQEKRLEVNHVVLTGILVDNPQTDKDRNGEPVTLLLVAFAAPDAMDSDDSRLSASCEIEVPRGLIEGNDAELRTGSAVIVSGQLTGGGGVIATYLHSSPPPPDAGAERPERIGR
jgi:Single-strand binding protein family